MDGPCARPILLTVQPCGTSPKGAFHSIDVYLGHVASADRVPTGHQGGAARDVQWAVRITLRPASAAPMYSGVVVQRYPGVLSVRLTVPGRTCGGRFRDVAGSRGHQRIICTCTGYAVIWWP